MRLTRLLLGKPSLSQQKDEQKSCSAANLAADTLTLCRALSTDPIWVWALSQPLQTQGHVSANQSQQGVLQKADSSPKPLDEALREYFNLPSRSSYTQISKTSHPALQPTQSAPMPGKEFDKQADSTMSVRQAMSMSETEALLAFASIGLHAATQHSIATQHALRQST